MMIKKLFKQTWAWIKPYLTPRMIPIMLTIWFITNGAWYVMAFAPLGLPPWLKIFAISYLGFLWSPIGIEKPIIIVVSLFLYRLIYKEKFTGGNHEYTE